MKKVTTEYLKNYFAKNNNQVISRNKVRIESNGEFFSISYLLEERDDDERIEKYELYDEVNNTEEFLEAYNVASLDDLKLVNRSSLWLRYLAGKAELIFTNGDENSVHFKRFRDKTMVYSWQLNYYTEVYKVLNMTEHFKKFVDDNWELIEGMSYKR